MRSKRNERDIFTEKNDQFANPSSSRWPRYAMMIVAVLLGSFLWFSAQASELASASETASTLDEVNAGQMLLKPIEGGQFTPALTQDSTVHIKVSGMVAHVSVSQRFKNQSTQWVEGNYVFPLPDKAAVNRMRMVIGERIIEGEIKEKSEAKKIYHEAKAIGKKATLVTQQRPNMFTSKVANIGPNEIITVQLEYIETIAYDQGEFNLRFPMTITPRYIPGMPLQDQDAENSGPLVSGASGWAVNTDQVPGANEITPFINPNLPTPQQLINPITITAELDMGMPLQAVESAYHNIVLARKDNRYQLRLAAGQVSMTQDFSLTWRPQPGDAPRAAVFSEQIDGENYALLMMVPPNKSTSEKALPKEAIYIIDTSGSMDGVSIKQARQSLLYALDQLNPQDRFNVISFSSDTHMLYNSAVSASTKNIDYARRYVNGLNSGGGTEMLPALKAALRDEAEQGFVRQVMFITDGAVGNETALFEEIHRQLGNSRLFTVGIGSAPNSHFMRKAAQFGRGSFTHIGKVSELQEKMTALFRKLDSPVVTDIQINWPNGAKVESYPNRIPDLYKGEPLLVAVKVSDLNGAISLSGKTAGEHWQQELQLNDAQNHSGVATLWAREKIANLLDEKTTGRPEIEVREAVLDVALTHQLVTPYTSFITVEQKISRPAKGGLEAENLLNARAKGQADQAYAYPQTATSAQLSLLWGSLLVLMAWIFKVWAPLVTRNEQRSSLGGAK